MKPITSQDTKWTRLQTTQGPKHQHAKLRGLGCLPTRSTQPERYSCSPGHHDLSVQIQRLKRPLIAKVWLPKLWASTIHSIWTCGRPNSSQGARRYAPRNANCADKSEMRQIIFQGRFGDLIFVYKESNKYQTWRKFCAIQPLHLICIIWSPNVGDMVPARKGCESGKSGRGWFYGNQVPFSPKEDLVQGKVENAPRLTKGINTTPWAPKEGRSIHPIIKEPPTQRRSTARKPTAAASPRVA
jgi:hypothetical protein